MPTPAAAKIPFSAAGVRTQPTLHPRSPAIVSHASSGPRRPLPAPGNPPLDPDPPDSPLAFAAPPQPNTPAARSSRASFADPNAPSLPSDPPDPTASLCLLVSRGDPDALARLYTLIFPFCLSYAGRLARRPPLDESLALDLVHDAVIRLVRSPRALRRVTSRADLERWVTVLIRSCAADRARSMIREFTRRQRFTTHAFRGEPDRASPTHAPCDDEFERAWSMLEAADPAAARALAARFTRFVPHAALTLASNDPGLTSSSLHARIRRVLAHVRARMTERHP